MEHFDSSHLIKSEDLNHHGTLYAARTASWFVEAAFVAAACAFGRPSQIVCRNIHGMSFSKSAHSGDVLCFSARIAYAGTTSLTVHVSVFSQIDGQKYVDGFITFVTVDEVTRKKMPHNITLDETDDPDELDARRRALELVKKR